jgi:hypothetical protein
MYGVHNYEYTYGYTQEKKIIFDEYFPDEMAVLYKGKSASLYICQPDSVETTRIPNEAVAEHPVPVVEEIHIPDVYEALLEQERIGALLVRRHHELTEKMLAWIRKNQTDIILEKDILHDNNGKGAENAIRIGIKVTRLNADYTPTDAPADFFIYEPNVDAHNEGVFGYVDTPSIDGTDTLIEKDRIITQSVSYWYETDPVQRDVLVHHMGKFDGSSVLFSMDVDEVVKIQMIVWLEGQDVDCTNAIADARVVGNLQFEVKNIGGSGLVPIPSDDTES